MQPSSSESIDPNLSDRPQSNNIEIDIRENSGQAIAQMTNSRAMSLSGSTYIEKAYFAGSAPSSATTSRRETPSLLPYLADRSEQEYQLSQFLLNLKGSSASKPVVIFIHGDEFQCHLKFIERLRKVTLPRILAKRHKTDPDQVLIQEHLLDWPSGLKEFNDLPERLRAGLAETVLDDPSASLQDINQSFHQYPGIKMVSTTLLTSEWRDSGGNILEKLLEFWQNWPSLMPDQKLIVCISVKYQLMRSHSQKKSLFSWLFQFLKYWKASRRRSHCRKINNKMVTEIKEIETSKLQKFDQLFGIVLPELDGVNRSHAEAWVRREAKEFVGDSKLPTLMSAVRDLFDTLEPQSAENEATMSMEDFANKLIEFLNSDLGGTQGLA